MRISQKEKIQLGYDPNPSPKTPSRSSDIDFSDVFGGPPRRASLQEMQNRHSSEHDDDDHTWRGDGEGNDETLTGRSSSSNGEKPVFGSEILSRRRHQSQDFFDDIFRGDQSESQSSSPRMGGGRDPNSSAPGSRVLSPARPLPPGAVPLGSPAQFSLPARLASSHSSSNLSRLSGQGHDAFQGGDAFSPYRRSPLSHKATANGEEIRNDGNLDGIGGGTQVTNGGNQFHFSIHKWASKGVPLVMSLRKRNTLRSKIRLERSLSLNDNVEVESDTLVGEIQPAGVNNGDDVLSFKVNVVSAAKESKGSDRIVPKSVTGLLKLIPENKVEDGNSPAGIVSYFAEESEYPTPSKSSTVPEVRANKKSVTDAPKLRPENKVEDGNSPARIVSYYAKESEDPAPTKTSTSKKIKDVSKPDIDADKSDLKQSSNKVVENKSAASSDVHKKGYNEEFGKSKLKEQSGLKGDNKRSNINDQKKLGRDTAKEKVDESIGNDRVREKVKGEIKKDGAKGKVKEFVKIFNQEPSLKPTVDIDGKSPSGRWRNTDVTRVNSKSALSSKVDENHTPSSGRQFEVIDVQEPCQSSSIDSENLGSTMDIDVTFDSILIEELPQIQEKTSENSENNEDMQAYYESKIHKWSKGKEGNIRALLSTLQYVLWPDSGWKPVPLVDIIEGKAVKRSYQRALLFLHPDKLQQKGAASHQKFIAEKVFDILQEAWDHFNTLGSL